MSRVLAGCAFVLVLLTTAATADAKGPTRARVCGEWVCLMVGEVDLISSALALNQVPFHLLEAPRPAPFYEVKFQRSYGPGFPTRYLFVPSRGRVRVDGQGLPYWRSVPGVVRRALERMTRGLRPYPAPRSWPRTTPG